jgi:hypothetical protein
METIMAGEDEISEQGRKVRFERWERLGLDWVKHDLLQGGHQVIGGPPAVRELAREWVRIKEAEQAAAAAQEKPAEMVPSIHGIGIDLKEAGRRIRRRFKKS